MKKILLALAALWCLAGCNSELGPEYRTGAVFGEVLFNGEGITAEDTVPVTVEITSQYGLNSVFITYELDGKSDELKATNPYYYTKNTTTLRFSDSIPKQKAGTKVRFQVCAYTPYGVVSVSDLKTYTVIGEPESESGETL